MKECIADERSACQDRVDRQAFKEKVEWSHRQQVRDGALRHEISGWLEAIIADLEESQEKSDNQEVVIRKLMRRKSKRETKAIWSEIRNGVLRRTNSVEDISDNIIDNDQDATEHNKVIQRQDRPRVRHSSEGNYDDVTAATVVNNPNDETGTDENVYENVTFFQGSAKFGDNSKKCINGMNTGDNFNSDIHKFISHHTSRKCGVNSPADYEQISSLLPSEEGGTKQHSDSGSVDSHNDSGYGTRMGQSSSSPELTDSDIHHHHHHHQTHSPYYSQVTQYNPYIYTNSSVVISPSSLV